jgi:hypothetical protein
MAPFEFSWYLPCDGAAWFAVPSAKPATYLGDIAAAADKASRQHPRARRLRQQQLPPVGAARRDPRRSLRSRERAALAIWRNGPAVNQVSSR